MKKNFLSILIYSFIFFILILFFMHYEAFTYKILLDLKDLLVLTACFLLFILTFKLVPKKVISLKELKNLYSELILDIFHTKISIKRLVWCYCCFLLSIISLYNNYLKFSIIFFSLSFLVFFRQYLLFY